VNEIGWGYRANGEMRNAYTILIGNLERKKQLRNLSVDRRIISKLNLRKKGLKCGLD
jgi:hypothetical protein